MANPSNRPPHAVVLDMLSGYWKAQALYVVAHLGIADLLKDGPRSAEDLATASGAHPQALFRLLRALAGEGVFVQQPDGRFALTPPGSVC